MILLNRHTTSGVPGVVFNGERNSRGTVVQVSHDFGHSNAVPLLTLEVSMDDLDLAWAAGFFEGEGTVRINKPTKQNLGNIAISVVNTDKIVIEWFNEQWPGYFKSATGLRPDQSKAWVWVIASKKAAVFLRAILPFVKRDIVRNKILLALEFQDQKTKKTRFWTKDYKSAQWAFYDMMKVLNRRGAQPLTQDVFMFREDKS